MKNNNILLSITLLFLSAVLAVVLFVPVSSEDLTYGNASTDQHIVFASRKGVRTKRLAKENELTFNQIQSYGAIGTGNSAYAGKTTFRAPSLKSNGARTRSYVSTGDRNNVQSQNTGVVLVSDQSGSFGRTGNAGYNSDSYGTLAALGRSSATIVTNNPTGNIFYAPKQSSSDGSSSGIDLRYTSPMTKIGADISDVSMHTLGAPHVHHDDDGDGYCDDGDGYHLDYRPGDGTGEFEEVWVPLGDNFPLVIFSLISLIIAYWKFRK